MSRMTTDDHRATPASQRVGPEPPEPFLVLTRKVQLALAALLFAVSAWLTAATVSYLGSRSLLMNRADYIFNLEQAYEEVVAGTQTSTRTLVEQIAALEAKAARQQNAITQFGLIKATLERQLASRERQLGAVTQQRDHARDVLAGMEESVLGTNRELAQALQRVAVLHRQNARLDDGVVQLETRLADATRQRDAVRRAEQALRWQVARLETQLQSVDQNREVAQLWFKDWVAGSVDALQELFVNTGVDLEVLVARAGLGGSAAGGPFQAIDAAAVLGGGGSAGGGHDPMAAQVQRLSALQKLASSMPLASPLDHFHVTSHFGKRRDPFTRRWAFHGGLDLGAAPRSDVLATAPGSVVQAGPSGPYGLMVEIDHGMGVTTRYGHLSALQVEPGDEVDFREPIGTIGSTGRSTALHLHYEVRIDDKAFDPAKFLEAGRYLVDVFNLKHPGAAAGPDATVPTGAAPTGAGPPDGIEPVAAQG
jgi:murein DD-endopeptidase MepM/ murein hydrolase activator NlpD